mmetsp:Transcript_10294/g.24681  ORF Transcript_10294/g.24681 Transcript_10294/m.24681 type:complete len:206 (-) Transcript_10294:2713-3330(-)
MELSNGGKLTPGGGILGCMLGGGEGAMKPGGGAEDWGGGTIGTEETGNPEGKLNPALDVGGFICANTGTGLATTGCSLTIFRISGGESTFGGGLVGGAALSTALGAGFSASGFLRILGMANAAAGFSIFAGLTLVVGVGLTDGPGALLGAAATGLERIFLGTIAGLGTAADLGAGLDSTTCGGGAAAAAAEEAAEPLDIVDCKVG